MLEITTTSTRSRVHVELVVERCDGIIIFGFKKKIQVLFASVVRSEQFKKRNNNPFSLRTLCGIVRRIALITVSPFAGGGNFGVVIPLRSHYHESLLKFSLLALAS